MVGWADARLGKALCFSQGGELYPTVTDPLEDMSQGNDMARIVLDEDHSVSCLSWREAGDSRTN